MIFAECNNSLLTHVVKHRGANSFILFVGGRQKKLVFSLLWQLCFALCGRGLLVIVLISGGVGCSVSYKRMVDIIIEHKFK